MARDAIARHCRDMSKDPTRRAHGGTTEFDWTQPPREDADERGGGRRGMPDPQLIVAGLALVAALVLVILAF
jgi:hypothetical protein